MPLSLRFLYRHYWDKQWLSVLYKFLRKLAWRVVYELGVQCAGKRCIIGQMFGCLSRLLFEGEKCVSGILFYWWEAVVASKNFSVWFCFYLPNTHIQVNVWWVRSVKGGEFHTHIVQEVDERWNVFLFLFLRWMICAIGYSLSIILPQYVIIISLDYKTSGKWWSVCPSDGSSLYSTHPARLITNTESEALTWLESTYSRAWNAKALLARHIIDTSFRKTFCYTSILVVPSSFQPYEIIQCVPLRDLYLVYTSFCPISVFTSLLWGLQSTDGTAPP